VKDADFRRAEFVYWSRRLVKDIVHQQESTRTRWRFAFSAALPFGPSVNVRREALDYGNDFALTHTVTSYLREVTGPISDLWRWNDYVTGDLELELGVVEVHAGWEDGANEDIAVMRSVLPAPEGGETLVALFGSVNNYRKLKGGERRLAEIPSDVDGLYGILDRTLEPKDPKISAFFLDGEVNHGPDSRAEAAERLLDGPRFKAFRTDTFEVLIKVFARVENGETDYESIVLGTPIWVAERRTRK